MQLGAMNSPFRPVRDEIDRIAAAGFDFVDLTLEPPGAWRRTQDLSAAVAESCLDVVGHTAFYLPIASPFAPLRAQARALVVEAFDVFAALGAKFANLHPDPVTRAFPRTEAIAANAEAVSELAEAAAARALTLMVENLGPGFGTVEALAPLLDAHPAARFHLDVAHAHLGGDRLHELLTAFGDRLVHVHVSDNVGVDDLHLPLGAGSIVWPAVIEALKRIGYDGTVTLEVFSPERHYLEASRRLWSEWWG